MGNLKGKEVLTTSFSSVANTTTTDHSASNFLSFWVSRLLKKHTHTKQQLNLLVYEGLIIAEKQGAQISQGYQR